MHRPRPQSGFTLLELLVAIAVFALMAGITYMGLFTVLEAREEIDRLAGDLGDLQQTMQILERDLAQTVNRPHRDMLGDRQPAWLGGPASGSLMAFTRDGWPNPAATRRSDLRRVAYQLDGDRLLRVSWPHVDGSNDAEAQPALLLQGLEGVELRFLGSDGRWQNTWPSPELPMEPLPRAVELTLDHPRWGRLQRSFLVGT